MIFTVNQIFEILREPLREIESQALVDYIEQKVKSEVTEASKILATKVDISELRTELKTDISDLRTEIQSAKSYMIKWMFKK
jgi:hypothetical protein